MARYYTASVFVRSMDAFQLYTSGIETTHSKFYTMRLQKLTPKDPAVRITQSLRQSTLDNLDAYQAAYQGQYGEAIERQALIEQMLLDYMAGDKDFQKALAQGKYAKPAEKPAK